MKVSVAVIAYNHERFIAQAIESVLAQKVNFDFEIVIGEDCSTDRTRAVIMDFYRRHPDRIVLVPRPRDVGPMRNMESTLAACPAARITSRSADWPRVCARVERAQLEFTHRSCKASRVPSQLE